MLEDPFEEAEPQTPPGYRGSQDAVTTPIRSTPPASPSFSLYSLGMSPFSPLRRQFSTPYLRASKSPESHAADSDLASDSKDVLVQRLNDLTTQLASGSDYQGGNLDLLHAKVDDMEKVLLSTKDGSRSARHTRTRSLLSSHEVVPTSQTSPVSIPGLGNFGPPLPISIMGPGIPQRQSKEITSLRAEKLSTEAQKLQKSLETAVGSFRERQEETEQIHNLLVMRAERAAQRIVYLESYVQELENERSEGEMEILNLQIQLKAIEVQSLNHAHRDADPELVDSIETWKAELSALRRKRGRKNDEDAQVVGSPTPRSSRRALARSRTAG